jgi:cystine transport system ATP-binding protein
MLLRTEFRKVLGQLAMEGTTMVMAAYDLRLASKIANEVLFLEAGVVVETGPAEEAFGNPQREEPSASSSH